MQPTSPPPAAASGAAPAAFDLKVFVLAMFFTFGGITSLNDVLIPKLKGLFALSYAEVMLVQSAFFIGYLVVSIPAGALVARIGYMRAAAAGLLTMAAGCLLFVPAAGSALYVAFLGALFVVAAGITIVQVVANPLISMLGSPETASSRLTFAQGFNSLGTTIFPPLGAMLILGAIASGADVATEARVISRTYIGIAVALCVLAALVWMRRNRLQETRAAAINPLAALDLLRRPRFAFGMLGIFAYVGAEVAIGSLLVNYLAQPTTLALSEEQAGHHLAFYWGGAMIGRFAGALILRWFTPGKVLTTAALAVLALILVSANSSGAVAGWSLLAVGLFNSIMFPTIFTLACEKLGARTAEGSGLICVAIVGGAILPPLTGHVADSTSLAFALVVPAASYALIAAFGWYARRPAPDTLEAPVVA
ncbi:sugar MFS transporter [Sphingomonas naphthae]|uniref:Sugar MFS transporter n=1 Tax=Sphingomonas naphthae TaxID=1813468 RepID=A0ABY7TLK4_9SPHN|nr:sugar MFS transporter [Sphingomonas naphthae]WCT73830.1 sugar MFS transporter [Sphingomonas naphthae]